MSKKASRIWLPVDGYALYLVAAYTDNRCPKCGYKTYAKGHINYCRIVYDTRQPR
jgi:DNA-directed RNA polymerase subunit RPC12/RpoP